MESKIVKIMSHRQTSEANFFCRRSDILRFTKDFSFYFLQRSAKWDFESVPVCVADTETFSILKEFPPLLARSLLSVLILQGSYRISASWPIPVLSQNRLNVLSTQEDISATVLWEDKKWNLDAVPSAEMLEMVLPMRLLSLSQYE